MASGPTPAERELFREAVAGVVPLSDRSGRAQLESALPPAIVRSPGRDNFCAPLEWVEPHPTLLSGSRSPDEELAWLRPGLARKLLNDLRRGRWKIEAGLDLHGFDRDSARDQLIAFVAASLADRRRCVRIVHGQGRGLPGSDSVLKSVVRRWLAHRAEVLAYCQAPAVDGGAGAVWVLLRVSGRDAADRK